MQQATFSSRFYEWRGSGGTTRLAVYPQGIADKVTLHMQGGPAVAPMLSYVETAGRLAAKALVHLSRLGKTPALRQAIMEDAW